MSSVNHIHFTPEEGLRLLENKDMLLNRISENASNEFVELFTHGSLAIEFYKPDQIDRQSPHERDEVYVITSGTGLFNYAGTRTAFKAGDLLFVPAGVDHRFEEFTDDFATWVLFYGPIGGEAFTVR